MTDENKRNLVYFENSSMRGLHASMEEWQRANNRRLLSLSIQQDGGNYCCIALTNPTEVTIVDYMYSNWYARVDNNGRLQVSEGRAR